MFAHYKGLLLTGSTSTENNQKIDSKEHEEQKRRTEAAARAVYVALKQQQINRESPYGIHIDERPDYYVMSREEEEDLAEFDPDYIENGQEIDETYSPYAEEEAKRAKKLAKAVKIEIPVRPIQRSQPVPIRQLPKLRYPFGIDETNVYIGSYRNLNQFDLLKHELCDVLTAGYTNVYVDIKEKARKMTREDLCAQLVPILLQDGNLFYYDVETTTLMAEDDILDFLSGLCIKKDNEVTTKKTVAKEECFIKLSSMYPIKFVPSEKPKGYDYGWPMEPEEPPVESHRLYNYVHALFDARRTALSHNIQNIEDELNKGSDMNMVSINRLIRFFSDEFNFLPQSEPSEASSYWPSSPEPTPSPKANPALFSYICEEPNISL